MTALIPIVVLTASTFLLVVDFARTTVTSSGSATTASVDFYSQRVSRWGQVLGDLIHETFVDVTSVEDIQSLYNNSRSTIVKYDGDEMIQQFAREVSDMLSLKAAALQRLVSTAENSYAEHVYNASIQVSYPNAKKLTQSNVTLTPNAHFSNAPVNLSMSDVQVPTNVWDQSAEVLNTADWSSHLDPIFSENFANDQTISWQYFGSNVGLFRIYPAVPWSVPPDQTDFFDVRTRPWYIQAASSPKDVVTLLDASGSMTGVLMSIGQLTVNGILNTLSDDDFFSVIAYSDYPVYVDNCFNGTLAQANADNIQRMVNALPSVQTNGTARLDRALSEAFRILQIAAENGQGSQCNQVIIIVCDAITETYESIFTQYNSDKRIRVFTYAVGSDTASSDVEKMTWIACQNDGYFAQIPTPDVDEFIQLYVNTLSRPLAVEHAQVTAWTSVYISSDSNQGFQLMTTVAHPVFDLVSKSNRSTMLVGVMGTDIPVEEITKVIPDYKLGAGSYSFAITNNGYIVFHPEFRPLDSNGNQKPGYNSVDLNDVEFGDNSSQLERLMVDRNTGNFTMTVQQPLDNWKRVIVRNNSYFFAPINGTPFSLGLVVPNANELYTFDGRLSLNLTNLTELLTDDVLIAPWTYCNFKDSEQQQQPAFDLLKMLADVQDDWALYSKLCTYVDTLLLLEFLQLRVALVEYKEDPIFRNEKKVNWERVKHLLQSDNELVEKFLFDLRLSQQFGELRHGVNATNDETLTDGIESVFVATGSGLTWRWTSTNSKSDLSLTNQTVGTVTEMYYQRAVEHGAGVIVLSVPFNPHGPSFNGSVDWSELITASSVVTVSRNQHTAVSSVVGLEMTQAYLQRLLLEAMATVYNDTLQPCSNTNDSNVSNVTSINCQLPVNKSSDTEVYIVDNNAFVVYSKHAEQIGQFFGLLEPALMNSLVDGTDRSQPLYKEVTVVDHQSVCQVYQPNASAGSFPSLTVLRFLWTLLVNGFWTLTYILQEIAILLFQWQLYISGRTRNWVKADGSTIQSIMCDEPMTLIESNLPVGSNITLTGVINNCSITCNRPFTASSIAGTNLFLLIVDATCTCDGSMTSLSSAAAAVSQPTYNDASMCQRLQRQPIRRRPSACYTHSSLEDDTTCSLSSTTKCHTMTLFYCMLIAVHLVTLLTFSDEL